MFKEQASVMASMRKRLSIVALSPSLLLGKPKPEEEAANDHELQELNTVMRTTFNASVRLHKNMDRMKMKRLPNGEVGFDVPLPFLIFDPYSRWRVVWDVLMMLLLFYSLVSVPYLLAFQADGTSTETLCESDISNQDPTWYVELVVDLCFICDILVTFRTAFLGNRGLVTDWKGIAANYMRGMFIVDLVSAFPLNLLILAMCATFEENRALLSSNKFFKLLRLVRVLRLLRVARIKAFMEKLRDMWHVNPGILRLVRFLLAVCLFAHYNACLMYYIGEFFFDESKPEMRTWITSTKQIAVLGEDGGEIKVFVRQLPYPSQKYLVSLYWAITTMCTIGCECLVFVRVYACMCVCLC